MKSVTVHQAKTHLSRLLAEVRSGEEVLVCRGREPVARLVPVAAGQPPRPRVGELSSAAVHCSTDCWNPLGEDESRDWGLG